MSAHRAIILFILASKLTAQQTIRLEGTLTDSLQTPLQDANVNLLYQKDSSLVKSDITDSRGAFRFDDIKPDLYFINLQAIGYRQELKTLDLSRSFGTHNTGGLVLQSLSSSLQEVEIVSHKRFLERKPDKLVMNVENSIHSAGNSALELLQKAPGVLVNQDQSIALSGKQGVIILIDGRKTQLSGIELMNYLRTVQASNISRIEIITNPSAKYDAEGNAGIIDIRLRKDTREGFNGNANVSIGQGRYFKPSIGLNTNYRKGKFNLFGNYSFAKPLNFTNFYINRQFFNSLREVNSIFDQSSVIRQDLQSHTAKVGIDYYFNPRVILGGFAYFNLSNNQRDGNSYSIISNPDLSILYQTRTRQLSTDRKTNVLANLNFKKTGNKHIADFSADLDYGNYKLFTRQDFNNQYVDPAGSLFDSFHLQSKQMGSIDVLTAKADYSRIIQKIKLDIGAKSSFVRTNSDLRFYDLINGNALFDAVRSGTFVYHENINAAYIILSQEYHSIEYQGGLRAEQTRSDGTQINLRQTFKREFINLFPSLLIHYKKWKDHDISFSYSRRIDRPTFRQLQPFKIFVDPYTYVVGDPLLLPSLTHSFELIHTLKDHLITTFNYSNSRNVITDVFTQDDSSKISYQSPANIAYSKSYTLTLSYPFQKFKWFNSNFDLSGFYTDYAGPLGDGSIINQSYSWYTNIQNTILMKNNWSCEISYFYQSKMAWGQFTILDLSQLNFGIQKQSKDRLSTYKFAITDILHQNKIRVVVDHDNQKFHTDRNWDSSVATFSYTHRFGKSGVQKFRQRASGMEDEKRRAG
ncbi:MAG: outer membrane beta-barrel protein [Saprospiraceae bacterium]